MSMRMHIALHSGTTPNPFFPFPHSLIMILLAEEIVMAGFEPHVDMTPSCGC
jgi:hypothetical protein